MCIYIYKILNKYLKNIYLNKSQSTPPNMSFVNPNELMLDICRYISQSISSVLQKHNLVGILSLNKDSLFDYGKYIVKYDISKDLLSIKNPIFSSFLYDKSCRRDSIKLVINYFSEVILHGVNNDYYFYIPLRLNLDLPKEEHKTDPDTLLFNFSYIRGKTSYFDVLSKDLTILVTKYLDNEELYLFLNSTYELREHINDLNFWLRLFIQAYPMVHNYCKGYLYKFDMVSIRSVVLTLNKIIRDLDSEEDILTLIFTYHEQTPLNMNLFVIKNSIRFKSGVLDDFSNVINLRKYYSIYYKNFIEPKDVYTAISYDGGIPSTIYPEVPNFEKLYKYVKSKKIMTNLHQKLQNFVTTGILEVLTHNDKYNDEYLYRLKNSEDEELDNLWSNILSQPQLEVKISEDITPLFVILINKLTGKELQMSLKLISKIKDLGLTEYYNKLLLKIYGQYYYEVKHL